MLCKLFRRNRRKNKSSINPAIIILSDERKKRANYSLLHFFWITTSYYIVIWIIRSYNNLIIENYLIYFSSLSVFFSIFARNEEKARSFWSTTLHQLWIEFWSERKAILHILFSKIDSRMEIFRSRKANLIIFSLKWEKMNWNGRTQKQKKKKRVKIDCSFVIEILN